jgi:hypothetical protein
MPTLMEVADSPYVAKALGKRAPDLVDLAEKIERDPELLRGALDALGSDSPCTRFAAAKLLRIVSEQSPEALYPYFDSLMGLLHDGNSILRWNAMLALGNLAAADRENKLELILEEYLAPIDGHNLIDAANTMRGATAIARAKPYLADRIAKSILGVESSCFAKPECRNVAIAHAILALGELYPVLHEPHPVQLFMHRQLKNPRRATADKARRFLEKWPHGNGHGGIH